MCVRTQKELGSTLEDEASWCTNRKKDSWSWKECWVEALQMSSLRRRRAFGGAAEVHAVDMQEANQLAALEGAVLALEPVMETYRRVHRAYKFQVAVDVMFHKAVYSAVVTQPPATLRCERASVYAGGSPQQEETYRHLLELIEGYEHNGSGWVFSSFVSLQLTL